MLNTREVAARLSVSYCTVLRLITRGDLPAARVGGEWRVTEDDLADFLAGNMNTHVTDTPVIYFTENPIPVG